MAICSLCGKDRKVTLTVGDPRGAKGPGGPFALCATCWCEGARGDKLGNIKTAADQPRPKKGDKMGRSLTTGETYVATGEVLDVREIRERERSKAKADVASFAKYPGEYPSEPEPEKPFAYTGGIQYVPDDDGYW